MSAQQLHLLAAQEELRAAESHLTSMLDAAWDDETANERIAFATARLRRAQTRYAAARAGVPSLPDLVGQG